MRSSFEGQYRPAGGISFDAANTMHGGYAEASHADQQSASRLIRTHSRDATEAGMFLDMLGLPRPGRE